MLSAGSGGSAVVLGVVALPGTFGGTVSEAVWVLSAPEALSGWRAGWLSDATFAVLPESGTCPNVAGGTIKRPNPSSQVDRRGEYRDITALLVDRGTVQSFYS
jgi:hypothetical protein